MRSPHRTSLAGLLAVAACLTALGCGGDEWVEVPGIDGAVKTAALKRSERRLYDGAPPVIPHQPLGAACSSCHDDRGVAVDGLGFAPPSPHLGTAVEPFTARCRQCHVFDASDDAFVVSSFVGLPQNMRLGGRLNPFAPPTIPHRLLMRENCLACHAGPAVRREIATTHPERTNCRQCHLPESSNSTFESDLGNGLTTQNEQD